MRRLFIATQTQLKKNPGSHINLAMLASKHVNFNSQVLLSPTYNLVDDFTCFLGEETMNELKNCDNYIVLDLPWKTINLGQSLFSSLSYDYKNLPCIISCLNGKRLCIAGSKDFSCTNSQKIASHSKINQTTVHVIDGADHIFNLASGESVLSSVSDDIANFLRNQCTGSDRPLYCASAHQ